MKYLFFAFYKKWFDAKHPAAELPIYEKSGHGFGSLKIAKRTPVITKEDKVVFKFD